jgi:ABC-type glycerol-3-phosphate transport system permease component
MSASTVDRSARLPVRGVLPGKSVKVALFYAVLIVAALIWFVPVVILILTALKDAGDFAVNGTFSLPRLIKWSNFSEAWDTGVKNYFFKQRFCYRR